MVKRNLLLEALGPTLLAFLLYLPSLGGGTIWDDHELLMNNTRVVETTVRQAFTSDFWGHWKDPGYDHVLHYRPLALLAYTAVFRIFDMDPVAVHLADVTLHAVATLAFFFLLAGLDFERGICSAAAFLFAVHPLHVEAVAWISAMSETLAAATALAALAFYVHGKRGASLLFAACAMLMKESATTIPALIFIIEWWRSSRLAGTSLRRTWQKAAWAAAPYVPLTAAYFVARAVVIPPLPAGRFQGLLGTSYSLIPAITGRYIALLFFPWPLSFCYDLHRWAIPTVGFAIAAAWIAISCKVKSLRRDLLLPAALVPICLALPIATSPLMASDLEVQDRYAYLASAGACLALAVLLNKLGSRWGSRGLLYLCLALIPVAAAATLVQERVWQSEEALWTNALRAYPASKRARFQLFVEMARLQRPAEALQVCQDGLQYYPDEEMFQKCLGLSKFGMEYLRKHPRTVVGLE
jgi:hypothetical protein